MGETGGDLGGRRQTALAVQGSMAQTNAQLSERRSSPPWRPPSRRHLRLNPILFAAFVPEAARGNVEDQAVLVPERRGTCTWRAQDGFGRLKRAASEIKRKDHAMQTTAAERGTSDVVTTHPLDPE